MDPTFDGTPIFGTACHVVHLPNATAQQVDSFFGVTGNTSLYGGGRGRNFEVTGVLVGLNLPTVGALEALLLNYADGIARTFVDTQGRAWPNVIFDGRYTPSPEGPKATDFGYCLPFKCVLMGLT